MKEDAGHKLVENYLANLGLESWASFRPQYMTGDGNNKDCEEWFFDRTLSNPFSLYCTLSVTQLLHELSGNPTDIKSFFLRLLLSALYML